MVTKWCGGFHACEIDHSPLDVVAWHGNFAPYKYNLRHYSPVGPILNDHADPSIFTVLTAPLGEPGTANVDFVIFPSRWLVAENSFRPPWYHMNIMSEFMGLIEGVYDAKPEGFVPGGMSIHNMMLPHGPDSDAFYGASLKDLGPEKLENTMAFMFETRFPQQLTKYAAELPTLAGRLSRRCGMACAIISIPIARYGTASRVLGHLEGQSPAAMAWIMANLNKTDLNKTHDRRRGAGLSPPTPRLRVSDPKPALRHVFRPAANHAPAWRLAIRSSI